MKTLTAPIITQKDAAQAGWCEVYDIYLKASIMTPFGTTDIIRITDLPGGLSFFTPKIDPEASGTQGSAATYQHWPIERRLVRGDAKFTNDKLTILASNVTGEWATMLANVDWHDVPFVIRKVSTTITNPTADDCVVVFSGLVDSVQVTREQLQFVCSNDLGTFGTIAPRENMHQNCRFKWADDQCTAIRFLQENFKGKTCGVGSTTTVVKSGGLSEDTGQVPWINQAVTISDDAGFILVALASHGLVEYDLVKFSGTTMPGNLTAGVWYYVAAPTTNDFKLTPSPGATKIAYSSAGSGVTVTSQPPYGTKLVNPLGDAAVTASTTFGQWTNQPITVDTVSDLIALTAHGMSLNDTIVFGGTTPPSPIVFGTTYYVRPIGANAFRVMAVPNGVSIDFTTAGSAVTFSNFSDYVAGNVRSRVGYWKFGVDTDWGTNTQGYWQLTDAQSGMQNANLTPWIQFDFGSAKTARLWRVTTVADLKMEELVRLIELFSSPDAATWRFEGYFELPPKGGVPYDLLVPKAASARYWRVCVRARWAESLFFAMFDTIEAHEGSRNWWASGQITFDAATTTVALRGVSRRVYESYSGALICAELPAAPVSGDTFVVERGCPRTFNACNERRNWENFGGFLDLPNQTIIR